MPTLNGQHLCLYEPRATNPVFCLPPLDYGLYRPYGLYRLSRLSRPGFPDPSTHRLIDPETDFDYRLIRPFLYRIPHLVMLRQVQSGLFLIAVDPQPDSGVDQFKDAEADDEAVAYCHQYRERLGPQGVEAATEE